VNDAVDGAHSAASRCHKVVASKRTTLRGAVHGQVSTIGLDIAKSVFQIHGVDVDDAVVIRKRITRAKLLEFFATLPACPRRH
jgi:hypothetical protein